MYILQSHLKLAAGVEVKGESSNTVTKVELQRSNSDLDNKLNSRTKDSTMPN